MTGRAVALPAARPLGALWRFSRPHTIIGTTVSIVALYLIAVDTLPGLTLGGGLWDLWWTLVAGLAVNVYIVGINQLEDVEIDRVNKPFLPLAAGEMTRSTRARGGGGDGRRWPSCWRSRRAREETVAVLAGARGRDRLLDPAAAAQALPGRRRRCASPACARSWSTSASTRTSRSRWATGRSRSPPPVWALTIVVLPFSFAIAILKDVPDAEGDRRFRIMTFTVRVGGAKVLRAGVAVLALAYVGMAVARPARDPRGAARACSRAGTWRRWALLLGVGARRGPGRPGRLHALLHARVEAVLPRVRARRARLPGRLALAAPGEHGDQARRSRRRARPGSRCASRAARLLDLVARSRPRAG